MIVDPDIFFYLYIYTFFDRAEKKNVQNNLQTNYGIHTCVNTNSVVVCRLFYVNSILYLHLVRKMYIPRNVDIRIGIHYRINCLLWFKF